MGRSRGIGGVVGVEGGAVAVGGIEGFGGMGEAQLGGQQGNPGQGFAQAAGATDCRGVDHRRCGGRVFGRGDQGLGQ